VLCSSTRVPETRLFVQGNSFRCWFFVAFKAFEDRRKAEKKCTRQEDKV